MHVTEVRYERTFAKPNYENEKIAVTVNLTYGENPQEAMMRAKKFVEGQRT